MSSDQFIVSDESDTIPSHKSNKVVLLPYKEKENTDISLCYIIHKLVQLFLKERTKKMKMLLKRFCV